MSNAVTFEKVVAPKRIGKRVNCKCGYEWNYFGVNERWCHCPRCHTTITFNKAKKEKN